MDEQLYPKIQSSDGAQAHESRGMLNFMEDKVKLLQKDLTHYKKIKSKWSVANTVLKGTGISVSCVLAGTTILTVGRPLSVPIATVILGSVSLGNATVTNLLVEGFTSKRKRYFREKCDYSKSYLEKMEVLLLKIIEDCQVTPTEFKLFQELLKEYEREASLKAAIKSKDLKKIEAKAKKQVRDAAEKYVTPRDYPKVSTNNELNLFCCPVIYI